MNTTDLAATSKHRLYGLDHLRTLAILLVFLYHYGHLFPHPEWTNTIGKFGWTGVDLFFVLSGYLIASQLFRQMAAGKGVPFRPFFIKRIFRILPAYWTVVAIYFLIPAVHEREALAPLWKYLSFTQNLGLDLRSQGTFSHAWSLCVEEHFYLLLPGILALLLYWKRMSRGYWLLVFFFLTGFLLRYYSFERLMRPGTHHAPFAILWYKWIYYPTYCRLDGLLTGVGIAAFLQYRPKSATRLLQQGNSLLFLGLGILAIAYGLCLDEQSRAASLFGFPLVSLGYGLLVLAALSPSTFLYRYRSGVTARIAAWSYGIYLIHKFTVHIVQEQFARLGVEENGNLMLVLAVVFLLSGAWLLNSGIEKTFLRLRDKLVNPERPDLYRKQTN